MAHSSYHVKNHDWRQMRETALPRAKKQTPFWDLLTSSLNTRLKSSSNHFSKWHRDCLYITAYIRSFQNEISLCCIIQYYICNHHVCVLWILTSLVSLLFFSIESFIQVYSDMEYYIYSECNHNHKINICIAFMSLIKVITKSHEEFWEYLNRWLRK